MNASERIDKRIAELDDCAASSLPKYARLFMKQIQISSRSGNGILGFGLTMDWSAPLALSGIT